MKKFLPLLALLLSLSAHATQLQFAVTATNAGASPSITLTSTTAGSLIVVMAMDTGGAFTGVPTDNKSNTYTATGVNGTGLYHNSTIWYVCNATAGVTSVTINGPAGIVGIAVEESGVTASSCYDQHASAETTGSSWSSGNTGTLAQADEVAFGFVNNAGNSSYGFTAGGSWTEVGQGDNTLYGPLVMFGERQAVTATTALAATGGSNASGSLDAGIATFKQASGATCTNYAKVVGTGALTIPTASTTVILRKDGSTGTTPCDGTGTQWKAPVLGSFVAQ